MSALSRFVQLPPKRQALLLRAWVVVAGYRLALTALPFRHVRHVAAVSGRRGTRVRAGPPAVDDLSWAVSAASRRVPRATCLTQALALQTLLARQSLASDLHIGVARDGDGRFEAHAWLEAEGRVLIGGGELERFTPLARVASPAR